MNDELNKSGVGRPTKYSEETIARLCEALADGMPIKASMRYRRNRRYNAE